ncbi:calpain-A-like [Rhopalosiphum maidis]|uniref:calpain-A-like n=1 Tax=Rhopalosiphum maidis TaxID=43146 RepID=UPI000EFF1616|nr:calpain-A-like [Rhopalosiphum maidis]XP_026821402.1 calpain-A-like [Rhopalosiphum maidis]
MSNIEERGFGVRQRSAEFVQNFEVLRNQCLKEKKLFTDPEFNTYDLTIHHKNLRKSRFEWRRPNEIAKNPQFIMEGVSRFDVKQGKLGDCWLLAAIANLTLNEKLFYQVVPYDQGFYTKYAGIFHFRFWQYGKWVDVVIDDRLPTYDGKLMFLQSAMKNEFWSALLEKAYAKIHGSYEALEEGCTMEGMGDFTGGVSEIYDLNDVPHDLLTIMLNSIQRQSLMCGSIFNSKMIDVSEKGLHEGHAYSITKITSISIENKKNGTISLIRLRNPWGENEWNGPWSDESVEWLSIPQAKKKSIGLVMDNDGEFWMSFEDFVKYFSILEICNLAPDDIIWEQYEACYKWNLSVFEGEWVRGATAGGCDISQESFSSNPQYNITLKDPDDNDSENMCTVIISLMKKYRQRNRKGNSFSIKFLLFDLNKSKSVPKPLDMDFFNNNTALYKFHSLKYNPREISKRLKIPPGKYCIVPCTSNQNEAGEFLLRVFSEKKNNLEEFDNEVGMCSINYKFKELALNTNKNEDSNEKLKKYFLKVAGSDKEVDWMELKDILDVAMKQEPGNIRFSNDVCRCMIAMMDWDRSGKLGFKEFQSLWLNIKHWKVVFKSYDIKNKGYIKGFNLRPALNSVGYSIKTHTINTMCHRYANRKGYIMFDDFIMCAIKLKTTIDIFKERDPDSKNVASFTLEEWVEKTFYL